MEVSQQEINVQASLMSLVNDNGIILCQVAVTSGLSEQDTIGHELDLRIWTCMVMKTDLVTNQTGGSQFFPYPLSH